MTKPLTGILVVAVEQAAAAPYATARLADAGARVIKVERPGGDFARGYDTLVDGQSSYFVWLNRGKESIALDIKDADDAALLHRIVARADVFVQNLVPGAAARAGFGAADLRARHPRLVTCDLSGYGEAGPLRDMKAYDLLVQAESGVASITGTPEAPGRVGVSLVDYTAGLNANAAILEALIRRGQTGEGAAIAISMFDGMADWMTVPVWVHEYAGRTVGRVGLNHHSIAPYGAYETGVDLDEGGGPVVIAVQNDREWRNFCEHVLEKPALADDPRFPDPQARYAHKPALDAEIDAVFGRLPREEVVRRLRTAQVGFAAVNSPSDLASHPQLRRASAATPAGPVDFVASPVIMDGASHGYGPVPALDEHGAAIRAEFAAGGRAAG